MSSFINFEYLKRTLQFRFDAGTSRGVLKTKDVFWIKAFKTSAPDRVGWGEAAPLVKLSIDDIPDFEQVLESTLSKLSQVEWSNSMEELLTQIKQEVPDTLPSIRFGVETAMLDLMNGGIKKIFENPFFSTQEIIPINGLIWMGDKKFMLSQIEEKLTQGFDCIKMKIGAIDFEQELALLKVIRERYSSDEITLRVDANGAFGVAEALSKLDRLASLQIHSIEQPIKAGQLSEMYALCRSTPIPIALDEELIGVHDKAALLDQIMPQYIILKPTLVGGILQTQKWIKRAEERNIGWWMTSALESNIGLNAIAQLSSYLGTTIPQGLGTGKLYHNNLKSPLEIEEGHLVYKSEVAWENPA